MRKFSLLACLALVGSLVGIESTKAFPAPLQETQQKRVESDATDADGGEEPQKSDDDKVSGEKRSARSKPSESAVDIDFINTYANRNNQSRKFSRLSTGMVDLFPPLIASYSPSTVRLYSGKDHVAIGTVIDGGGLILTVASELKKDLTCRLPDGTSKPATVLGVDRESGLALLKVEAEGLHPLRFSLEPVPEVGSWVASVSPDRNPVGIGVVSVGERKITGSGAFIGIQSPRDNPAGRGVMIDVVVYESPAFKADIRVGDRIIQAGGKEVNTMLDIQQVLRDYAPGDNLDVVVLRGSKELSLTIVLATRDQFERTINAQDQMGSTLSKRRQGFAAAFQHDTFLQASNTGSPLVDLDGRVVGVNISRAGRVSSLALPMSIVLPSIEKLKSGELAPAVVNAKRIEQVSRELNALEEEVAPLPNEIDEKREALKKHEDKIDALKSVQDDLAQKLKELLAEKDQKSEQIKAVRDRLADLQVRQKQLRDELESLKTGTFK